MFRNRSQKPPEGLIADFKAAFPGLSSSGTRSASLTTAAEACSSQTTTSLTDALDVAVTNNRQHADDHELKDLDPTPRANIDQWRFTPSLLDPNSFAFSNFANQPPGYYTPTPGGTNTIYHPQAGDLHTPGFTMGLGTPLSMPTSGSTGQISHSATQAFHPQAMAPHVFQNPNPFAFQHAHHQTQPQQTYAPHQFTHHPTPFDSFHHVKPPKIDEYPADVEMQEHSIMDPYPQQALELPMATHAPLLLDNLRYHATLNAPTAMIKHPDEIPVTYLNKGQAYSIKIVDTKPGGFTGTVPTYRTYIRISFEDEQQRARPSQCWQLWKEGRGSTEAHHRGGRLQAVEFVDPNSSGGLDQSVRPKVEIESSSFDGFAVKWAPAPHGPSECQISLRFNFLSTDFSHSKGVKGIPVRLCAKTQLIPGDIPMSPSAMGHEICFGKVKLFRDHGAERKLSNDIAHVKKSIDKLQQQIAQLETGMKDFGKRKRSESGSKPGAPSRPGKVPKHKRTWSMSSVSDTGNKTSSQEDDLHVKLTALQDMFTSTRPQSVLFLKGEDADDPDLNPVYLNMEITQTLKRVDTGDSQMWEKSSTHTSSIVSPTPSHNSPKSQDHGEPSAFQRATPFQPSATGEWVSQTATGDLHSGSQHFSPPDIPVKIQKAQQDSQLAGWIEALGVDYTYQPPAERVIKPVACFYIQPRIENEQPSDNYYRAVYLMQRTLKDLINGVSTKSGVEPSKVLRTLRINSQGLSILLDDESVVEIHEGQDMVAEFQEIRPSSPMKREWDSGPTDIQVDGDIDVIHTVQSEGYELRLIF